ncbi:MAG: SH3 domain-containing protein [Lachnospiraceae bacterium]|nr:SH3 domain-containing protein [Lachnospiraceae bacterium]
MNTSNNNIRDFLMAKLEILKNWIVKNAKIVMPVVLAVCVIITIVISVNANKKAVEEKENVTVNNTIEETTSTSIATPEVPLEENAHPEINELMNSYYKAIADGDIDTIQTLVDKIDNTEIIRIEEMSKYIESYPTLDIYTKVGPAENSYLVYACSEVKFFDYENTIPGMKVFYVCMDENGKYYINNNGEENESDLKYIKEVSLQDDAVELNNKVAVAYNDMLAEDEELGQFILDLKKEIDKYVGEALAQAEGSDTTDEPTEEAGVDAELDENTEEENETVQVVTKVRAIDVVNIRSSDSETADKLGKAAVGDEFKLLEKKGNGWSKIEYEGSEAYIKSEYLEDSETTEMDVATNDTEPEENEPEQETESNNTQTSGKTVTVIENVRIRSSASEDSEKLGTAYVGEKLDVIMKQADGWTKINYKGQTAYVKSEFVK